MDAALQQASQQAITVWLTGLSGAGKSTLANGLHHWLGANGYASCVLDGDALRAGLCKDLGFSEEARAENIRRVSEVAKLMNGAGLISICALISPRHADRELARSIVGVDHFIEVYVSTPLAICEDRDPKGLYRRARSGDLRDFTGISAPYDAPVSPQLVLAAEPEDPEISIQQLIAFLRPRVTGT